MTLRQIISTTAILMPGLLLAKGTITGSAVNKDTGEPLDYAMVQLFDAATNKPLAIGGNTDEQGYFTLVDVPDGKYILKISSLGSIDQERPVTIKGGNVEIGVLRLTDDSKVLQEVVVEGVKSQMRFELDRKVFSVDSSIAAAGQSASELLESIPSVEVDQDGEVSLRGNSSVTVWINGKESGLSADNRAQILEQIPGETIERIEVITNPSAKYSPEGSAGIINIVLKKDRRGGYFGSAELGANTRGGGNAGVSINLPPRRVRGFVYNRQIIENITAIFTNNCEGQFCSGHLFLVILQTEIIKSHETDYNCSLLFRKYGGSHCIGGSTEIYDNR